MATPATNWHEDVAADEDERFADYARRFTAIQSQKSAQYGRGRALHRKQLLAVPAEVEVLADLPEHARHGFFAQPGRYRAAVRLSNGGLDVKPDAEPDIRGFALRVEGVNGPGALGADTDAQCFLLINHEAFSFPKSAEFIDLVEAAARGTGSLLGHLFGTYGIFGAFKKIGATAAAFRKPFTGFATESFFSAAPIACGPYAARVRLVPTSNREPKSAASKDWGADFRSHLAGGPLVYDLQLQFFTNAESTPIEDASVIWDSPYTTVARLTIPQQDFESGEMRTYQEEAEASVFDPWLALAEHRPLGDVMRARKHVYYASQQSRGVTST